MSKSKFEQDLLLNAMPCLRLDPSVRNGITLIDVFVFKRHSLENEAVFDIMQDIIDKIKFDNFCQWVQDAHRLYFKVDFNLEGMRCFLREFQWSMSFLREMPQRRCDVTQLTIDNVDYDFTWFNEEQNQLLATAICNNVTLTELTLLNLIRDEHACTLASALGHNHTLTSLTCSNTNALSFTPLLLGVGAFASVLQHTQSIEKFTLSGYEINVAGAKALAEALATNKVVSELDLSENGFTSESTVILANMLRRHRTIGKFKFECQTRWEIQNFRRNSTIGDVSMLAFGKVLKHNPVLHSLYLDQGASQNPHLTLTNLNAILKGLKHNRTITTLALDNATMQCVDDFVAEREAYFELKKNEKMQEIEKTLKHNSEIARRTELNWGRVGILFAFMRANQHTPLQTSVLPCVPGIMEFL